MYKTENAIKELRVAVADHADGCERLVGARGHDWALTAAIVPLKRLAAAVDRCGTARRYIDACVADPRGLTTRLFADIEGGPTGASPDADEALSFWTGVLQDDRDAIDYPDIAAGFVAAAREVWATVQLDPAVE